MKKLALALVLSFTAATPAHATLTQFLVKQWISGGQTFCQYTNGTVLNIGVGICAFTIEA